LAERDAIGAAAVADAAGRAPGTKGMLGLADGEVKLAAGPEGGIAAEPAAELR
jgi:hypothetical protein